MDKHLQDTANHEHVKVLWVVVLTFGLSLFIIGCVIFIFAIRACRFQHQVNKALDDAKIDRIEENLHNVLSDPPDRDQLSPLPVDEQVAPQASPDIEDLFDPDLDDIDEVINIMHENRDNNNNNLEFIEGIDNQDHKLIVEDNHLDARKMSAISVSTIQIEGKGKRRHRFSVPYAMETDL